MIRVFGREQGLPAAVEAHLVEVAEVRIPARLLPVADEEDGPGLRVDVPHLGDVSLTARDPAPEAAGGEVVPVKMAPVLPLRPPDHFPAVTGDIPARAVAGIELDPGLSAVGRQDPGTTRGIHLGEVELLGTPGEPRHMDPIRFSVG